MTSKQIAEQLKQVKRYEKQAKLLNTLQKTCQELIKTGGSLGFILDNMADKFDDSFMVALENEINRTNINVEFWQNVGNNQA